MFQPLKMCDNPHKTNNWVNLLWIEEILHQLIDGLWFQPGRDVAPPKKKTGRGHPAKHMMHLEGWEARIQISPCLSSRGHKLLLLTSHWLVVWNILFLDPYIGNNNPNWLSYFSEGLKPLARSFSYSWALLDKTSSGSGAKICGRKFLGAL